MTILLGVILRGDGGIPVTDDKHQYDIFDIRSKAYDSYRLAQDSTNSARDKLLNADKVELLQSDTNAIVYWIYEAEKEGGMFSSKGLDDIKKAEDIYLQNKAWDSYCELQHYNRSGARLPDDEVKCKKPISPMTIFYPDSFDPAVADSVISELKKEEVLKLYNKLALCIEMDTACEELMVGVTDEEKTAMEAIRDNINTITTKWTGKGPKVSDPEKMQLFCAYMKLLPTRAPYVDFYFDKDFSVSNPKSMFSRSILRFGGPREGYTSMEDKEDEQDAEVKKFVKDELLDDMKKVAKRSSSDETNTFYYMTEIIFDVFLEILIADTISAIFSILMVYFYLWYMLGSLFLASVGMLEIILSIPCAWFIFRGIFQIQYFAGLNMLTIFIVAAIGADDIFVFMDAYKQSANQGSKVNRNLQTRLSWVWRKAGLAMAITSATTCCGPSRLASSLSRHCSRRLAAEHPVLALLCAVLTSVPRCCCSVSVHLCLSPRANALVWHLRGPGHLLGLRAGDVSFLHGCGHLSQPLRAPACLHHSVCLRVLHGELQL